MIGVREGALNEVNRRAPPPAVALGGSRARLDAPDAGVGGGQVNPADDGDWARGQGGAVGLGVAQRGLGDDGTVPLPEHTALVV